MVWLWDATSQPNMSSAQQPRETESLLGDYITPERHPSATLSKPSPPAGRRRDGGGSAVCRKPEGRQDLRRVGQAFFPGVRVRRAAEWEVHLRARLWDGESRLRHPELAKARLLRRLGLEAIHGR